MRANPQMDEAKIRKKYGKENRKQARNRTIRALMLKERCVCSLETFEFYLVI